LQIVHSLSDLDKDLQFFCQFHGILTENPGLPNNLLKSNKEHFNLHRTVNKQNFQYWSAANPHKLHQRPFIRKKVTVWCAIWSRGVNGPYFFEDESGLTITVTSQCYTEMINEFLVPKLLPKHNLWFQHDGDTVLTAVISMAALHC